MDVFTHIEIMCNIHITIATHFYISSVQFSCSVMSDSLRPHAPQHTRPPCPSPTSRVHPNHVH